MSAVDERLRRFDSRRRQEWDEVESILVSACAQGRRVQILRQNGLYASGFTVADIGAHTVSLASGDAMIDVDRGEIYAVTEVYQ